MIQIIPTPTHTTITTSAELFYSLDTSLKPKATYTHNDTDYVYITLPNQSYAIFEAFLAREKVLPI